MVYCQQVSLRQTGNLPFIELMNRQHSAFRKASLNGGAASRHVSVHTKKQGGKRMDQQRMTLLQELFLQSQHIHLWRLTRELKLLGSNCPEEDAIFRLFSASHCRAAMETHFAETLSPLITSDRMGFVWIAAISPAPEDAAAVFLLGPVLSSELNEALFQRQCRKVDLTAHQAERLWQFAGRLPALSFSTASGYARMLHWAASGGTPAPDKIPCIREHIEDTAEDVAWGDTSWHGSWFTEQLLFRSIMEGRYEDFGSKDTGNIGNIGGGNPIRQAKNEIIVFAVLCSRAAILGGVSPEGSLNLCDYYFQRIEATRDAQELVSLAEEMQRTYVLRVQKAQSHSGSHVLVRACMDYVDTHIFDRITLSAMSREIGYGEYYISRKFKSETGESLVDYINRQKIEMAKRIMLSMKLPVSEISSRLSFSSPSYFSAVFRKITGIGPVEYQNEQNGSTG